MQPTGSDEDPVGRPARSIDAQGDAQSRWTSDDLGTPAVAEVRGGGEGALPEPVSWWDRTADRRP